MLSRKFSGRFSLQSKNKPKIMNAIQLTPIIKAAVKSNTNFLITGAPGIGKSSIVEQVAKEMDCDLITEIGAISDPTDYKGAIYIDKNGEANFKPFKNLRKLLNPKKETIMFIDDLGWSPPSVLAAISSLILLREVNGEKISDKVRFISATNRKLDNCNVGSLPLSLISRFGSIVNLDADANSWKQWALKPENKIAIETVAFINFRPNLISNFTGKKDLENFACPRTWEACSKWCNLGLTDLELISGCVGPAAAIEFLAFYKTYKDLAGLPEKVINNPLNAPIPDKPDVLFALMGALSHKANLINYDSMLQYIGRKDFPTEFSVFFIKDSTTKNDKLMETDGFIRWSCANQNYIK